MATAALDDVDDLLEESYKEKKAENHHKSKKSSKNDDDKRSSKKSRHRSRSKSRSKSPHRSRSKRSRSREKDRERSKGGSDKRRSKSPARERRRSRTRSKSRDRNTNPRTSDYGRNERFRPPPRNEFGFNRPGSPTIHRRSETGFYGRRMPGPERRDVMPFSPRCSPPRGAKRMEELTTEERDARTVFCMQLSARVRPRDLEDFFSSVGKVRDVRIITDSKTKRSKGIGYVEFYEPEAVPLSIALSGQRLQGAPLIIQATQSEKNRLLAAQPSNFAPAVPAHGPMKLYIGSLHFNITEEMLRGIFEPFGKVDNIQLLKEPETGRSRGYGFITFRNSDNAKQAMEQLNGFELAGRAMKVGHVTEHNQQQNRLDSDEMDRAGLNLGTTGRIQLMAKLAEGTGMVLPQMAQQVLNMSQQQQQESASAAAANSIATQCFMLSNMFDPTNETIENWELEIRDDVIEECNKHGGILHIFVDKMSPQGNVYVKCPTVACAVAAVNSLHGRWFAGKIITANYVPVPNYHQLFPDAQHQIMPLHSSSGR